MRINILKIALSGLIKSDFVKSCFILPLLVLFATNSLYAREKSVFIADSLLLLESPVRPQVITVDTLKKDSLLLLESPVHPQVIVEEAIKKDSLLLLEPPVQPQVITVDTLKKDSLLLLESPVQPQVVVVESLKKDSLFSKKNGEKKSEESLVEQGANIPQETVDTLLLSEPATFNLPEQAFDSLLNNDTVRLASDSLSVQTEYDLEPKGPPFVPILLDPILLKTNPLFIDLVYTGIELDFYWRTQEPKNFFFDEEPKSLESYYQPTELPKPEDILADLRRSVLKHIANTDLGLYKMTFHDLPTLSWNTFDILKSENEKVYLEDKAEHFVLPGKIDFRKRDFSFWNFELRSLLQFSQISVSDNWYKGGSSYLTVLGNMSARIDYDNRKSMKWENFIELRTGFNAVPEDSLRSIMPSDDLLKGSSKFGLKAGKDVYYSSSLELQTQFFNNPKKINSRELKAKFLTPIRLNIGIGMDYKPNKILSVAVSPLSYKVIYLTDISPNPKYPTESIDPNAFGIKNGRNLLHEFGSKVIVLVKDYRPLSDLKIDTRFSFYTNYEKVEIDWEIITEYTLNRFLSTRLVLNPRFDNTAIFKKDEKARLQMKQILTVGISYRFY